MNECLQVLYSFISTKKSIHTFRNVILFVQKVYFTNVQVVHARVLGRRCVGGGHGGVSAR